MRDPTAQSVLVGSRSAELEGCGAAQHNDVAIVETPLGDCGADGRAVGRTEIGNDEAGHRVGFCVFAADIGVIERDRAFGKAANVRRYAPDDLLAVGEVQHTGAAICLFIRASTRSWPARC